MFFKPKPAIQATIFLVFFINSCSENFDSGGVTGDWLVPEDQVVSGGPPKDGIPALEYPEFVSPQAAGYLSDDDLVLGIRFNGQAKAYPHNILDWHEIVNDKIADLYVAVTYCPLTGTGIGFDPVINGNVTTFGVSGLLFNNNLIPYDRNSDSNWSQMKMQAVNGELIGMRTKTTQLIETSWSTWKQMFPETEVISENTGFNRNYTRYPYGDYKTNNSHLLFAITPTGAEDTRLPRKDRVHGIISEGTTRVYPFKSFESREVLNENLNGQPIVVLASPADNLIVSFKRRSGQVFEIDEGGNPEIYPFNILDQDGSTWNFLGEKTDGTQRLEPAVSYNAYWFAWGVFWPGAEIFGQ